MVRVLQSRRNCSIDIQHIVLHAVPGDCNVALILKPVTVVMCTIAAVCSGVAEVGYYQLFLWGSPLHLPFWLQAVGTSEKLQKRLSPYMPLYSVKYKALQGTLAPARTAVCHGLKMVSFEKTE